ncbi:MAG: thioredoxin domain-containing protein [Acidimicrobiia bacterium]|nr:thioredoxin domain-containing protein [Acidimicrobiia bacterium]
MRRFAASVAILVAIGACGGSAVDFSSVPELPEATPEAVAALLSESDKPVVLNVWASWCIPCRSEAPLLERAAVEFQDEVTFIGINFRNDQTGARRFIAEFFEDAPISHFIDRGDRIPIALGGTFGVPQTFFYAAGGELVGFHPAVIDERTLALQIDEILARSR